MLEYGEELTGWGGAMYLCGWNTGEFLSAAKITARIFRYADRDENGRVRDRIAEMYPEDCREEMIRLVDGSRNLTVEKAAEALCRETEYLPSTNAFFIADRLRKGEDEDDEGDEEEDEEDEEDEDDEDEEDEEDEEDTGEDS